VWVTPQVDGSLAEHQTDVNGSARNAVGGLGEAQLQVLGDIAGGKPDVAGGAGGAGGGVRLNSDGPPG
jgi:hypothetical protein